MKDENLKYKTMKYLIINADDFGISEVFNEQILNLIQNNHIKSTTVMVNRIDIIKQNHQLIHLSNLKHNFGISVWLHLEFLNESFEHQIQRQYDIFVDLFWFEPSHIDLHKLAYIEDSYKYIEEFCITNKLPMRNLWIYSEDVIMTTNRAFSGTGKSIEEISARIENLVYNDVQEILFHPWAYDPDCKSTLNKDRELDTNNALLLGDILVKNNINVINYYDFKNLRNSD